MRNEKVLIIIPRERLTREERWEVISCHNDVRRAVIKNGFRVSTIAIGKRDFMVRDRIKRKIAAFKPRCVFNLFEGLCGDSQTEAVLAKILEEMAIPFTGNGSRALKVCLNKALAKRAMARWGIPVPAGLYIKSLWELKPALLHYPVFVKPAKEDASLGIDDNSLVASRNKLISVIRDRLRRFPDGVIVEEFLWGNEYSAGFLGREPYELLGISVLDYSLYKGMTPFLTYNCKWKRSSPEFKKIMPSLKVKIDKNLKKKIISLSLRAARSLRCSGYFRVDLRQRGDDLFVLDVNPNPDISRDSGFMKQAYLRGYTFDQVIGKMISDLL